MKDKNLCVPVSTDLDTDNIEAEDKLLHTGKHKFLSFYHSQSFDYISFAASVGGVTGIIYGAYYFGHIYTGLLGLFIGGGCGYILDKVLPDSK